MGMALDNALLNPSVPARVVGGEPTGVAEHVLSMDMIVSTCAVLPANKLAMIRLCSRPNQGQGGTLESLVFGENYATAVNKCRFHIQNPNM